ncbi:MAG: FAD-dependent oxidoreductase [Oscillospiraceae bacterium]|nr:FAD-dependent oxidoreductase [Oscillospiraceae bacterium]
MNEIKLRIDGREVTGREGQTIFEIARSCGIEIPTLCHDDRVETYGSCGICTVEAEGIPKLLRSCSAVAADGMVIHTNTERVRKNRRATLELLLSDHIGDCRPPCAAACPAETDCQGYAGLIANGEYEQALRLIKEKLPLPASIGRVCPHPCESECRRKLAEEPVSIAALKRFAGDMYLGLQTAEIAPPTGKSIAVIGGGPGGLTAAYFLRIAGHSVTVFEAMPEMGGMLRYGIPEYRLPKSVLSSEIKTIQETGIVFRNNIQIGRDISLETIRSQHDAVVVAAGAWLSMALGCRGEELDGVFGGIEFLLDVSVGNLAGSDFAGKNIAVVGGGNSAMDACRTAIRLGADNVYSIYRRTKNEMPAEAIEIHEAEEEGVVFKTLTNPIELIGENGRVKSVRLQLMELGQPDSSGRRSPVPIEGSEETIAVDIVIVAIGQKPNLNPAFGLSEIGRTKYGTIAADEHTFLTDTPGVFAIGDVANKGADIAVRAIGEGRRAADVICRYLSGQELQSKTPYYSKTEKSADDFAHIEKSPRIKTHCRSAADRRNDFNETTSGMTEDAAKQEAARCLECGCIDFFECRLIEYANQYDVYPEKYSGKRHKHTTRNDHPHIHRNPEKCILCGLCVRVCDQTVGASAWGLVGRGFDTEVQPALDTDLRDTDCVSCGMCAALCPTGALTQIMPIAKQVPFKEDITETVCGLCSVGCKMRLASKGSMITRSLPVDLLCHKGAFGFGQTPPSNDNPSADTLDRLNQLEKAELIVAVGSNIVTEYGVAAMKIQSAVKKGARLLLFSDTDSILDHAADTKMSINIPSDDMKKTIETSMIDPQKTVIIFEKNSVNTDTTRMLEEISSGYIVL